MAYSYLVGQLRAAGVAVVIAGLFGWHAGHYDVQPALEPEWRTKPFEVHGVSSLICWVFFSLLKEGCMPTKIRTRRRRGLGARLRANRHAHAGSRLHIYE